jgi:hypothetical protein
VFRGFILGILLFGRCTCAHQSLIQGVDLGIAVESIFDFRKPIGIVSDVNVSGDSHITFRPLLAIALYTIERCTNVFCPTDFIDYPRTGEEGRIALGMLSMTTI